MGRLNYNELSKRRFKEQRNIVISEARNVKTNDLEGYAVTEQLVTEENGKEVRISAENMKFPIEIRESVHYNNRLCKNPLDRKGHSDYAERTFEKRSHYRPR